LTKIKIIIKKKIDKSFRIDDLVFDKIFFSYNYKSPSPELM